MLPCLLISQNPYIARLLCYIVAESLNGKTPQSNKQKKGFQSQQLTSEALDFKPFSALLCRRGLCLWHRMDSWRGAKHLHKAHNETIPKCRFAEKPCAASIFAKRKRLIVSNTFVSKLSTLFGK